MNTPIEKLILDLLALQDHYRFIERHGKNLRASDAIEAALKLLHKRLQEEADFALTSELFGNNKGKSIELMLPKSKADFEEFSSLISDKMRQFEVCVFISSKYTMI